MGCRCSRFFYFRERENFCKQIHFPVPEIFIIALKKWESIFFLGPNEIVAIYLLKRSQLSIQIRFCRVGWCCCWWIVRLLLSDTKIWKLSNNNLSAAHLLKVNTLKEWLFFSWWFQIFSLNSFFNASSERNFLL